MANFINITSSINCKETICGDEDENLKEEESNDIKDNEISINYISTKKTNKSKECYC